MSWYRAPHSDIASSRGISVCPVVVREYSTHGGLSLTTLR